MDFSSLNDQAILEELGTRIKQRRLILNVSQIELTKKAGVSRKVIQSIESGNSCSLKGFVRALRALGLINELDLFLPEPGPSPLEIAKLKGKERQRAFSPHNRHKKEKKK